VHDGGALLSPAATRSLILRCLAQPDRAPLHVPDRLASLTEREREVLVLVASGLSNEDIADRLVVSPHTAKTHVNRAMTKLGAHDRAQLVIIAYETGIVRAGSPSL
jgi:DNA-binding NarL/FixJ family response regulator